MSSPLLLNKIAAVRSKHTAVGLGKGSAQLVLCAIVWLIVACLFDWLIGFPLWFRACGLLALIGVLGLIIFRQLALPILRAPDDQQIALLVEKEIPEFSTRLIASIQLSQQGAIPAGISTSLVAAMIRQTEELAHPREFGSVIRLDRVMMWLGGALFAVLFAVALYAWGAPTTPVLLERAFLSSARLPTKTRVEIITGNLKIPVGDDVKISARALGIKPTSGTLYVHYLSGTDQQFVMKRDEADGTYSSGLAAVQESFTYSVRLNDGSSDDFRVDAIPRPAVTSIECFQVYPEYTGLGTVPRAPGDLTLLMGSKLQLRVLANRPVRATPGPDGKGCYVMRFTDEKKEKSAPFAMAVNPRDAHELTASIDLPAGTIGFSINLIDEEGITSKDPAVYRIDMVPDRPPTIRVTSPDRKEILATGQSEIDVGFVAEDDYGIGKVTFKYKVGEGEVQSTALTIPPKEKVVRGFYPWLISKIAIPTGLVSLEGTVLEFWIDVEDTNNLTGPGRVESEHYLARIVTRDEKKAELMARLGESLGTIRDISENQERASSELGMLITGQPVTPPGAPK